MRKPTVEDRFINRELSWLSFNHRVLQEAQEARTPLIERMRFLGIFSNNLDEFYRVRVANLQRMLLVDRKARTTLGFPVKETLEQIDEAISALQKTYGQTFREVLDALQKENIRFVREDELEPEEQAFVATYFRRTVRPELVPIMLGRKVKMPPLVDGEGYLAIRLAFDDQKDQLAIVQLPRHLPRFLTLPSSDGAHRVMFIEDVIRHALPLIFRLFEADHIEAYALKATRDAQMDMDDDVAKSVMTKVERGLKKRKQGDYVRILHDAQMPADMLATLLRKLKVHAGVSILAGDRYHNRRDLMGFPDFGRADLVFEAQPPLTHPRLEQATSVMNAIAEGDLLIHCPYHKFVHVVDFLREAAIDPNVTTIQMNLYRVAKNSQVINALLNAARNGKRVEVIVELAARFDEKHNMKVANMLQEAGAVVRVGIPNLKVHCKVILVTRRKAGRIQRFAHIGTGNFHERNASVYEDLMLLTANPKVTGELAKLFDFFENSFERKVYRHLFVSPFSTRRRFVKLIDDEIHRAERGEAAWMDIKVNNLVDAGMIDKLYQASQAGVKVRMVVRGICALRAGVPGWSDNIEVRSVVGRYLEHSRLFVFGNGGKPLTYISSADWMTRNLDRRVEVTVPIFDAQIATELRAFFDTLWADNTRARLLTPDRTNPWISSSNGPLVDTHRDVYLVLREQTV
jgi:polyphosphate kinase